MLTIVNPSERAISRLSLLADHMEQTNKLVNMSEPSTCAYGHACDVFGEEFGNNGGHTNIEHLSKMLGIAWDEAHAIYHSAHYDRAQVVAHLRQLRDEYANTAQYVVFAHSPAAVDALAPA